MLLPPEIDYFIYRQSNADLADLSDETLRSHFYSYGRAEGRVSNRLRDRNDFAALVDKDVNSLEIGPFANPVLKGPKVKYCDVLTRDELIDRATKIGLDSSNVPPINYVVEGGNLDEINDSFAAVLSSHSIEHQPDLIGHLQQVQRKLEKNSGRYFALIPDKRYCFDKFIAESTIAQVLSAHLELRKVHTLTSVIEHRALTTHNDASVHWNSSGKEKHHIKANVVKAAKEEWIAAKGGYIDVHAWYFTPDSFSEIIGLLNELGYLDLKVERIYHTRSGANEFWVILK